LYFYFVAVAAGLHSTLQIFFGNIFWLREFGKRRKH